MAIKMRVNQNKNSQCGECSCSWKDTEEMYDTVICGNMFTLCKDCMEVLFQKALRASCMYNGKVKSQEDIKRAMRARKRKNYKE